VEVGLRIGDGSISVQKLRMLYSELVRELVAAYPSVNSTPVQKHLPSFRNQKIKNRLSHTTAETTSTERGGKKNLRIYELVSKRVRCEGDVAAGFP